MRALKRIGKVAAWCVAVVAALALVVAGLRAYNANKYPIAQMEASGGASAAEYPQSDRVRKISGDYLNGFHFLPAEGAAERRGVVVVYGGSEGSPDYSRAEQLAQDGYEVLSLYFFGQDSQRPTLAEIPLEQFDEVTGYIEEHVANPSPVTVLGTSKGGGVCVAVGRQRVRCGQPRRVRARALLLQRPGFLYRPRPAVVYPAGRGGAVRVL